MGTAAVADAKSAHVNGAKIIDAQGHEMKVRGVTWGGGRFVPTDVTVPLTVPDVSTASKDFKRIQQMGANLVRVDVSSAANDDAHRLAFQKLQRLAKAHGLQILFANVPLAAEDQGAWLQTLASWFPKKPNVWYLPETDPGCGPFTAGAACSDTEAWIWSQGNDIRTLRAAGVTTPIMVNLPDASQSVSLNWASTQHPEGCRSSPRSRATPSPFRCRTPSASRRLCSTTSHGCRRPWISIATARRTPPVGRAPRPRRPILCGGRRACSTG